MRSYSTTGDTMYTELVQLDERKIQWSFTTARGQVRFTEDFSKDGTWTELGEFSMDGENWFTFFEMELKRTEQ